ncbi:YbdD/YjiX family protein [Saccharopolyspora sp. WRP15-2]|uniref:YbdD/YjiX family protein n=1 Tax=Saccharopolyspora oryzae TaxID=2997343 RepID=A0ABT4UV43_9PSEU|nr:YbdD/YjiX family protein [Saccharopolyspora oryzae]MDA3625587.1 YbdD/YjiX family protein [Saccharopolyspora oryzae]
MVGENDYQRYVDHLRARHPDRTPPSRREFERMKSHAWRGSAFACAAGVAGVGATRDPLVLRR